MDKKSKKAFKLGKKSRSLKPGEKTKASQEDILEAVEDQKKKKPLKKQQLSNASEWNKIMELGSDKGGAQDQNVSNLLEDLKNREEKDYLCDFETIFNGDKVKNDDLEELFHFPEDEVQLVTKEKVIKTVESTVPQAFINEKAEEIPYFVHQCLSFYSSDWLILKRRHEKFAQLTNKETTERDTLPKQVFEDPNDNSPPTEDKLRVELLSKYSPSSTDEINRFTVFLNLFLSSSLFLSMLYSPHCSFPHFSLLLTFPFHTFL